MRRSGKLESSLVMLKSSIHRTCQSNLIQIVFKQLFFNDYDFNVAFVHVDFRFWKVWRGFEVQHGNEDTSSPQHEARDILMIQC